MTKTKMNKTVTKGVAKTPVILQLEALECGAACLAMIAAYYGKWVTLEQARSDCGVSRDGSNAKNVAAAARSYGFEVKTFRRNPESIRKKGVFPCIIHWDMDHFVVLNGFRGKYACINDPARGLIRAESDEFDRSFSGVTIQLAPTSDFVPEGKRESPFRSSVIKPGTAGSAFRVVFFAALILSFLSVVYYLMQKIYIDHLLKDTTGSDILKVFTLILVTLAVLQLTAAWLHTIYRIKVSGKYAITGSASYMWKVLQMPMEFFSQRMPSDVYTRMEMMEDLAGAVVDTFIPLVVNTILTVLCLVLMLRESVTLTAVALSAVVINLFLTGFISRQKVNSVRRMERDKEKLAATTISGLEMVETIKVSGAERAFFSKWAGLQAAYNKQQVRTERAGSLLGSLSAFIPILAYYLIMLIGIGYVIKGRTTIGTVWMIQGLFSVLMSPAGELFKIKSSYQELRTKYDRVEDVLRYPSDKDLTAVPKDKTAESGKLHGDIELKNVTFGYSGLSEPVIRNLSLTIRPGSRVAIVGASGCGKSTLSKLISGLYKPWEGEVLICGKSRSEIDRAVLTSSIAVVDQDITLFEGTIKQNIKMWDPSIEDFEMIMAARDASVHDDITAREDGYGTRVLSGGRNFSGGQRQRLEIARVLAQDPSIIILDEATSALDAKTEYEVSRAIADRGITCIMIAHRLSTIRDCDEIVVLDKGRIAERGTHEELIGLGGLYTALVQSE
ncbi:MAG: ATP-binding cassette domain-containing protein [Eubacterium sp.]|nr:ATP-binding cassette domain-containing protein [Eubacterium sp.]